ncbi:MAG: GTPase Era [Eubacteriales bacterium]
MNNSNNSKDFRSGFVAVVGRPNAGKSTLLNNLLEQKILIISDKPQTTRNKIRCILTEERGQIIFLDTPGIHKPHHRLGEYMVDSAKGSIKGADYIVYVVDVTARRGTGDEFVGEIIKNSGVPCILALNKIDLIDSRRLEKIKEDFSKLADFKDIIPISALNGDNTQRVLDQIFQELPLGPMYYPEDEVTDQPERFIAAELIREKVLLLTRDEVPHSTAVVIEEMTEKKTLIKIRAVILVERESQKGIMIGKSGSLLKEVGRMAREDMEKLLNSKVFLELWVKVRKDWRNDKNILKEFGYNLGKKS